jgi:hypothetical protein
MKNVLLVDDGEVLVFASDNCPFNNNKADERFLNLSPGWYWHRVMVDDDGSYIPVSVEYPSGPFDDRPNAMEDAVKCCFE